MKLLSESLKEKKLSLLIFGGVAVLLIALMIIGSFFDLQIAQGIAAKPYGAFYYSFGLTFEVLGFLPAILVDVCLFAVLSVLANKKGLKIIFHILCASALAGAVYCGIFWTLSNHGFYVRSYISAPIMTVAGAGLSFPAIILFKRFERTKLRKLIYILAIGAVLAGLSNLIAGVLQMFWGRYRFFEVVDKNLPYAPWFKPFGKDGGIEGANATSFPSLHAASVCSVVVLLMAGWVLNAKKSIRILFTAITAVMLVCVPLSRMVIRWHYLTDVNFSLIIGFLTLMVAIIVIDLPFGKRFKAFIETKEADERSAADGSNHLQGE